MASAAPKIRPTIAERARERICPECGGEVTRRDPRGPFPTFCDAQGRGVCKKIHANRHIVEGRAVIAFLKAWRIDRAQGEIAQKAFAEVCAITDQFNAADLAAKKPRADLYAAKLLRDGTRYFDRQERSPTRGGLGRRERPEAEPKAETPDLLSIIERIAAGHNDPRALAAEVLAANSVK